MRPTDCDMVNTRFGLCAAETGKISPAGPADGVAGIGPKP